MIDDLQLTKMVKIYTIEGNIGSGKSTLVRILKEYLNDNNEVIFLEEPVKIWETIKDKEGETIISKFYNDQEKYAFSFQMMAYISRLSMLKDAIKEHPNSTIICERCLYTDKNVFAKMLYDDGKIGEIEYQIYMKWFEEFISEIPQDGIIYVKADPNISYERVIKRSRKGEIIPLEYLKRCHTYHEEWIQSTSTDVLYLNANQDKDFTTNAYRTWISNVITFIDNK